MKPRTKKILIALGTAVNILGPAGLITYSVIKHTQRKDRVAALRRQLEHCKEPGRLKESCLTREQRDAKEESVKSYIGAGKAEDYEAAGLLYVQLGNIGAAKKMIKKCEAKGYNSGAEEIREALKVRAEAFERLSEKEPEEIPEEKEPEEKPKAAPKKGK